MHSIGVPNTDEYHPYYQHYVGLVPTEISIFEQLKSQGETFRQFIQSIPAEKHLYAYEAGKWTIQELVLHLLDAERIFAYRALVFARQDQTPLPGMDENLYAAHSNANDRTMTSLLAEHEAVRTGNLATFGGFSADSFMNRGTANDAQASVRALLYIIAGHELHHMNVIRERYL